MAWAFTKKQLAEVAGYSYRQLYNIDRELPEDRKLFVPSAGKDGAREKYDLALFVKRWIDFCVGQRAAEREDLDAVKAQHEAVKMRKTELEVARMEGSQVDVEEIRLLWGNIASEIMQSMMGMPAAVAPLLAGRDRVEEIRDILTENIRDRLTRLSEAPLGTGAAEAEDRAAEEDQ